MKNSEKSTDSGRKAKKNMRLTGYVNDTTINKDVIRKMSTYDLIVVYFLN